MRLLPLKFLAASLGLLPFFCAGAEPWIQLKPGMTRAAATGVLGSELMASRGRGFEVAIYDGRAEVVYLNGQVVAWTAPMESKALPPPPNAFQFEQVARVRPVMTPPPSEGRVIFRPRGPILPAYRL